MGTPDPITAANRWLDTKLAGRPIPPLLLVVGLGDGHLLDVLERRAPSTRVLALEPDGAAAERFRARRDWSSWTGSDRFRYLVGPDYSGADDAWRLFPAKDAGHVTLVDPALEQQVTEPAVNALRVLKDIVFGARANAEARRRFAPRYLVNTLRNLPALVKGSDVEALAGIFTGVPAVVAGAGPSLDRNIEELQQLRDRALLIATDTALRPMLHAGLSPSFVVGLDPGEKNGRHFWLLPEHRQTALVGEPALDHQAIDAFPDAAYWFRVSRHQPWPWYQELGIDIGQLDVWGSVLTGAFQLAVLAGCDPIIFVGADLGFTDGRPYARGTTYEFDWAQAVARGISLPERWRSQVSGSSPEHVTAPDLRGVSTTTAKSLMSFRDWLVTRSSRSGRRVINASGAGMLFGGSIEQGSLPSILRKPVGIPSLDMLPRTPARRDSTHDLHAALIAVSDDVRSGAARAWAAEWADFCGEGYDAAATADALDAAAEALTTRQPRATGVDSARPTGPSLAPKAGLMGLPEREAALRAVLVGEPVPAWAKTAALLGNRGSESLRTANADAAAALQCAFDLSQSPAGGGPGLFGEDVENRWGLAVLDYRSEWSDEWRTALWDYHDAMAIAAADCVPSSAGAGTIFDAAFERAAGDIAHAPRACTAADLRVIHRLEREGVYGYNLVSTGTGWMAAAQRLGPILLPAMSEREVNGLARAGFMLWAPSEAELVARIERYLRDIVRLALVHEWAVVMQRPLKRDAEPGARLQPDLRRLLHRAAGVTGDTWR